MGNEKALFGNKGTLRAGNMICRNRLFRSTIGHQHSVRDEKVAESWRFFHAKQDKALFVLGSAASTISVQRLATQCLTIRESKFIRKDKNYPFHKAIRMPYYWVIHEPIWI